MPIEKPIKAMIGGDPEVFVTRGSSIIPSCGLIGGSKGAPIAFYNPYTWHEDNVSLEFNFPPCDSGDNFAQTVRAMKAHAEVCLNRKGLSFMVLPQHKFKAKELVGEAANKFGCDPDFDAYSDSPHVPRLVNYAAMKQTRFCGGHIHMSFNNKEKIEPHHVAILLDCFVGLPSVKVDAQLGRRQVYGKAGIFRPKPYGIEYRTMGPWWLQSNYTEHLGMTVIALGQLLEKRPDDLSDAFAAMPITDIRNAINKEDKKEAMKLSQEVHRIAGVTVKGCGHGLVAMLGVS